MTIKKLEELFTAVKHQPKRTLIAAFANDEHTINAVSQAVDLGLVNGVLVGDNGRIEKICQAEGIDVNKFRIVDQPIDHLAAARAVELINRGEGEIIMKGLVSTDKFMRALLNKEKGLLPSGAILSHVTVLENENYHKVLFLSDAAIIPYPSLKQKVQLIKYLVGAAHALGIEKPKVAVVAPTEQVLPHIESCSDAALLAKMSDRNQISGCVVDGPLALDVAIDKEAAQIKSIKGEVAGDADCLLFPNLDSGNIFYKANTKLAKAESAAIIVGAKVPAVLTSRGDSIQSKLYSIALAALMAP